MQSKLKKIILYSYFKCSTCRKATNWLDQKDIKYQLIDIVKDTPKAKYLDLALEQFSKEKKRIFNTRGKSFRLLDLDITTASNRDIVNLLLNDGKLIKRPFLVYKEKNIILGFSEAEYADKFL